MSETRRDCCFVSLSVRGLVDSGCCCSSCCFAVIVLQCYCFAVIALLLLFCCSSCCFAVVVFHDAFFFLCMQRVLFLPGQFVVGVSAASSAVLRRVSRAIAAGM